MAIEDIANQALFAIGYPERIGQIDEGTPAAKAVLEVWGQSRDELLRSADWPFARRKLSLNLLKGPPPPGGYSAITPWSTTYPMPGWLYEYSYPSDCLKLNAIIPPPGLMFELDPAPQVWQLENDNSLTPVVKVILCNVENAIGIYTGQVTDPNTWDAGFIKSLVDSIKIKLPRFLLRSGDAIEQESIKEEVAAVTGADMRRG